MSRNSTGGPRAPGPAIGGASHTIDGARVVLRHGGDRLIDERIDLSPDRPWQQTGVPFPGDRPCELELLLLDAADTVLVQFPEVFEFADQFPEEFELDAWLIEYK